MKVLKLLELSIFYDLAMVVLSGAWLWVLVRRRDWWLHWTAMEEAFWTRRFRIPPRWVTAYRNFAGSRVVVWFARGFLAVSLLLFLLSLGIYFRLADRLR